jgi:hypothetical protein
LRDLKRILFRGSGREKSDEDDKKKPVATFKRKDVSYSKNSSPLINSQESIPIIIHQGSWIYAYSQALIARVIILTIHSNF